MIFPQKLALWHNQCLHIRVLELPRKLYEKGPPTMAHPFLEHPARTHIWWQWLRLCEVDHELNSSRWPWFTKLIVSNCDWTLPIYRWFIQLNMYRWLIQLTIGYLLIYRELLLHCQRVTASNLSNLLWRYLKGDVWEWIAMFFLNRVPKNSWLKTVFSLPFHDWNSGHPEWHAHHLQRNPHITLLVNVML